jgi:SAM-dependent methyltransferase
MSIFRRLAFNLFYLRRPTWDTGIVPPEVVDYIASHPAMDSRRDHPRRAIDLGCGRGTSSLALAKAGWSVTGVDFAARAIRGAKRKAKNAGLTVDFRTADVTHLPHALFAASYDLVLDVGCFHTLSAACKSDYLDQLRRLLAPGGDWLLYSFLKPAGSPAPGMSPDEQEEIEDQFNLLWRSDGTERGLRPSAWFQFQKK